MSARVTDPGHSGALAATVSGDDAPPARDADDPLPRGTTIRHFVVLDRIGAGGMGVVYAAYDYGLDRRIALKLVRRRGDHTRSRARLVREAQALAKLSHPNVVAVYDVGQHGDDVYVAMELVEGSTLREWLAAEPRGWRTILDVVRRVGAGLEAAHAAGIVHRDVKPDNILVARDGSVRIGDFGLAMIEAGDATTETSPPELTATGVAMGTPAYMAPEQHAGGADVDARADQFAFCVTLYEALCGVRPFEGSDARAIAAAIEAGRLSPGRDVPAWILRVLRRGLARDPGARFPSMARLLDALAPRRRRWRWLAVAAGLGVVGALGVARLAGDEAAAPCSADATRLAGVWDAARRTAMQATFARSGAPGDTWLRVGDALDERAAGWQRMRVSACEATHVRREQSPALLDARMACLDDRAAELRALTDLLLAADRATVDHAHDAVRGLESLDACARGSVMRAGGQRATDAEAPARRERMARVASLMLVGDRPRALELARSLVDDARTARDRGVEGAALHALGQLRTARGDVKGAEQALYEALAAAQAADANELVAKIWLDLVWLVGEEAARPADAEPLARAAQGAIERLGGAPRLAAVLEDRVGVLLFDQGKYGEAAAHLERGLALRAQALGPASAEVATSLHHLAILHGAEGKAARALELHRRAREIAERVLGPTHPDTLAYVTGEGAALFDTGDVAAARALFERALAAVLHNDPDDARAAADLLVNIGVARRKQGELAAARVAFERALAMHEKTAGVDSVLVASVLANLGLVLADLEQYDDGIARLERAVAIQERALGREHPDVAATLSELGSVLMVAGRPRLAIEPIERALAIRAKHAGAPAEVADDRFRLARAMIRAGRDRGQALALADAARTAFVADGDGSSVRAIDAWRVEIGRRR